MDNLAMDKVYSVERGSYSDYEVLAVFDTNKIANEKRIQLIANNMWGKNG